MNILTHQKKPSVTLWCLRLVAFILLFSLSGCKKNLTYSYLMQHPNVLKKELIKCQTDNSTQETGKQCQVVISAAQNLMQLIDEQQTDPEKFGQKIMEIQNEYVASLAALKTQQEIVNALQQKNTTSADLQTARDKLQQIQADVENKQYELNVFMGIIGLNSPE